MTKKNILLTLSAIMLSSLFILFTPKQAVAAENSDFYVKKMDGSPAVEGVDYWHSPGPFEKLYLASDNLTVDMTGCKPVCLSLIIGPTCHNVIFKNLNINGTNTPFNPYAFDFSAGNVKIKLVGNNVFSFTGGGLSYFGRNTCTFTGKGKLSLLTNAWGTPLISYDDGAKIIAGKILASYENNAPEDKCTEMSFDQVSMGYNTCYIYGDGRR